MRATKILEAIPCVRARMMQSGDFSLHHSDTDCLLDTALDVAGTLDAYGPWINTPQMERDFRKM
jgi:hypothetical protein